MFGLFESGKSIFDSGFLRNSSDSHSHILYGVDDGVKTQEESLQILKCLEEAGVETLWLTPHIMEDVPNTSEALKARFAELQSVYKGGIRLRLAAEYMLDNLFMERLRAGDLLLHGENYVLVESSIAAPPVNLWEILTETFGRGYVPILAHPERYLYLPPDDYAKLREMKVPMQLNIFSLTGIYGEPVRARAQYLLKGGFYSMWGSDCHRYKVLMQQYSSVRLKKDILSLLDSLKVMPGGCI